MPGPHDTSAAYSALLAEILDLVGVAHPEPPDDTRRGRRRWQNQARRSIGRALTGASPREEWFAPLVRAAVLEPDPSFNRDLVAPMITLFGRRRVVAALLDHLTGGTVAEQAGASRAWYPTWVGVRYEADGTTPTASVAARSEVADVNDRFARASLRLFVDTDDLYLRQCLLPNLDLRTASRPTSRT
ncbi:hypothetical protein [Asanoa sp. NPDC050611]|uniref:hypothetical protein n=1 Tax=Asanoa sp. NPDC050611 TaxID=3157098 RepID=UPI0033EC0DD5